LGHETGWSTTGENEQFLNPVAWERILRAQKVLGLKTRWKPQQRVLAKDCVTLTSGNFFIVGLGSNTSLVNTRHGAPWPVVELMEVRAQSVIA